MNGSIGAYVNGRIEQGFSSTYSSSGNVSVNGEWQFAAIGFFNIGFGFTGKTSTTKVMLLDVTGDGLPEHVRSSEGGPQGGGSWFVAPNLGTGFGPYQQWSLTAFPAELAAANDGALARTGNHGVSPTAAFRRDFDFACVYPFR